MYAKPNSNIFTTLVVVFVPLLLISNISASKGVLLFPQLNVHLGSWHIQGLITDGAFFIFPSAYVIGDILSEVYGFKASRRAIFLSFAMTVVSMGLFAITLALPAAPFWDNQEAMHSVLGAVPQVFLASLMGYLVGELLNAWVMAAMKKRSGERGLVARMISSTVIGEFADTLIFCTIAAGVIGIDNTSDFAQYVVIGFLWKTIVEVLMLPISTRLIAWVKRMEPSYQMADSTDK